MHQNRAVSCLGFLFLVSGLALVLGAAASARAQSCDTWAIGTDDAFPVGGAVVWADGRYVAVGTSVATSFDGRRWVAQGRVQPMTSGRVPFVMDAAYNGSQFVGVGGYFPTGRTPTGSIATSQDGAVWTEVAAPADVLRAVAWGGGMWVAGGDGTILWSADGKAWEAGNGLEGIQDMKVLAIARFQDQWVAVGSEIHFHGWIAVSSDGMSWTVVDELDSAVSGVASNGVTVVAVAGTTVLTSEDGLAWSETALDTNDSLADVVWTGDRFVAAGSYSFPDGAPRAVIVTSPDAQHWTVRYDRNPTLPGVWRLVAGGPGVLATTFYLPPLLSLDGISWEVQGDPVSTPDTSHLHHGPMGLISLQSEVSRISPWLHITSCYLAESSDGLRWQRHQLDFCPADLAWHDGRYVAVGTGSDGDSIRISVSSDGDEWTPPQSGVPAATRGLAAVAAGPPGFVAVGAKDHVLFSSDGLVWQDIQVNGPGFDDVVWSADWAGDRFVVSAPGDIAVSTDGLSWQVAGVSDVPVSFAGGDGRIVGVGFDGHALLSSDGGASWQPVETGTAEDLVRVVWDGTEFAAVSAGGLLLTSPDGTTWTSEEIDGATGLTDLAAIDGRLVVAGPRYHLVGVRACPQPGPMLVVPGAAHTVGDGGSVWRSDLVLAAAGDAPVRADLWLRQKGGSAGPPAASLVVRPGQATPLHDIVRELFGKSRAAGAVLISADGPLQVASRTYTVAGSGSYGQNVPALDATDMVSGNDRVVLPGLVENGAFRSNLGLTNLSGEELTVTVELYNGAGTLLGTPSFTVAPHGWLQVDHVLQTVTADPVDLAYAVLSGSGAQVHFAAYASVIDTSSGDPVMVIPMAAVSEPLVVAAAAHTPGPGGIAWRTDLDLVNPGEEAATYHLELLPSDETGVAATPTLTLPARAAVRYKDLLGTVFGLSGAAGVRVVPESGELAATSRTYAIGPAGSFGQAVPAYPQSRIAGSAGSRVLGGLSSSPTDTDGFRTNIGAVNLTGGDLTLHMDLYAGDGQALGSRDLLVPAHGFAQANRVFRGLVLTPVVDGYARLSLGAGMGGGSEALLVYASVIDNRTGDPVLMPAVVR